MSNVDFDYEALREGFRHVVHADNEHQHAHAADRPVYPSQAAGQGFSHYGARIAAALEAVQRKNACGQLFSWFVCKVFRVSLYAC